MEIQVVQDRLLLLVGEADVVEVDREGPTRQRRPGTVEQGRFGGQEARRPTGSRTRLLELLHLLADAFEGLTDHL
ncbi:MAG: hypothetical protein WKF43_02950 [Acidimicrobiales bacterium]